MLVVYSTENCAQCKQAKILLDMKKKEYTIKMEGTDFTREELSEIAPNVRSFPVVFNDDTLIGGVAELKQFIK